MSITPHNTQHISLLLNNQISGSLLSMYVIGRRSYDFLSLIGLCLFFPSYIFTAEAHVRCVGDVVNIRCQYSTVYCWISWSCLNSDKAQGIKRKRPRRNDVWRNLINKCSVGSREGRNSHLESQASHADAVVETEWCVPFIESHLAPTVAETLRSIYSPLRTTLSPWKGCFYT